MVRASYLFYLNSNLFLLIDFTDSCLRCVRFRNGFGSREERSGIMVGRWRGISLSTRSFVSEFYAIHVGDTSFWRTCPLRESIIGAAAGGIGHPGLWNFGLSVKFHFWNYEWSLYILNNRLSRNGCPTNRWRRIRHRRNNLAVANSWKWICWMRLLSGHTWNFITGVR